MPTTAAVRPLPPEPPEPATWPTTVALGEGLTLPVAGNEAPGVGVRVAPGLTVCVGVIVALGVGVAWVVVPPPEPEPLPVPLPEPPPGCVPPPVLPPPVGTAIVKLRCTWASLPAQSRMRMMNV